MGESGSQRYETKPAFISVASRSHPVVVSFIQVPHLMLLNHPFSHMVKK